MGAKDATRIDSLTFRLINEAYASFEINTVIVEGPSHSHGANADRLMKWIASQRETDGLLEGARSFLRSDRPKRGARRFGVANRTTSIFVIVSLRKGFR